MYTQDGPRILPHKSSRVVSLVSFLFFALVTLLVVPRLTSHTLAAWSRGTSDNDSTLNIHHTPDDHARQILEKSLLIVKELLRDITDQDKHALLVSRSLRDPLPRRDLASTILGLLGGAAGGRKPSIAGASKFVGVGIGNGTLRALQVNKALLQPNTVVPKATGFNLAAENLGEGLSTSLVGSLNLKALLPGISALGPAVKALAQGAGSGAAQGLRLKVQNTTSFDSTGLSGIAGGFGEGLTYSFFDGIDIKKLMRDLHIDPLGPQANTVALSLAKGFGGGASYALNISSKQTVNYMNASGLDGLAGNIGSGLATSFYEGVSTETLQRFFQLKFTNAQSNEAALSLAQSVGGNAAFALKLSTVPPPNVTTDAGIGGVAANFGGGLTTSFLQNINISSITSKVTDSFSGASVLAVAQGLGSGLGSGAATAIGLQQPDNQTDSSTVDVKSVARILAKGTTESFLSNVSITKIVQNFIGGQGESFDISKVATGLGIGLVNGAQQSIENAGGIIGLLNMSPDDAIGMMQMPVSSTFNDSVGGIASGFATGLGFEATKSLLQVLGKPALTANTSSSSIDARSVNPKSAQVVPRSLGLYKQEASTPVKLDSLMLAKTLDPILQAGSNSIGCQGVGGLAAIVHSLGGSKALGGGKLANITMALGSFSNQTLTVEDKTGNIFTINVAQNKISVNGITIMRLYTLTAMHVSSAISAWVFGIPLIMMLSSFRNLALMTGRTRLLHSAPRWQLIIGFTVVLPSLLATLILGVLGEGKRSHFHTAHGILGLLLVIFTLLAMALFRLRNDSRRLYIAHNINLTLVIILTVATTLTGFIDLSTISFCIYQWVPQVAFVAIGLFFSIPLLSAVTMVLVVSLLQALIEVQDMPRPDTEQRSVIVDKASFVISDKRKSVLDDEASFMDDDSIIDIRDSRGWEKMFAQLVALTKSKSSRSSMRESSVFRIPRGGSVTPSVGRAY